MLCTALLDRPVSTSDRAAGYMSNVRSPQGRRETAQFE
jgi:hypothetical protein